MSRSTKQTVNLLGKPVQVELSKTAIEQLGKRMHHLCLEMELYFSCLIRKRVNVRPAIDNGMSTFVNDKLEIGFRPVMTRACSVHDNDGKPPLTDFPIEKPQRYIPHWLKLDYKNGEWLGEFGYCGVE